MTSSDNKLLISKCVVVLCFLVATIIQDYCNDGVRADNGNNNGVWFVVGVAAARPILLFHPRELHLKPVNNQLEPISTSTSTSDHDGHVVDGTNTSKPAKAHLLSLSKEEDDSDDEKAAQRRQQQRYAKELGMLGITYCKCCDNGTGVGAHSHDDQCKIVSLGDIKELASCSNLECLPWKLH